MLGGIHFGADVLDHRRNVHSSQNKNRIVVRITRAGPGMELQEAMEIVRKLADGLHPETGQSLPNESLYQNPQVVRALQHAVDALEIQDHKRRTRNSLPPNAGKPWIEEEDARLSEELRRGTSLQEIAISHNRRVGSIVARIMRLRQKEFAGHKRSIA
jgi:hypothetical protein